MLRQLLSFLVFIVFSCIASAETLSSTERTYQIEVIVFSHITAQGLKSEKWSWTPTQYVPTQSTIDLAPGGDADFSALPKNDFFLAPEQRLLSRNSKYHVLLHLAWQQRIPHPRHAQPVHIFGGNIYNSSGKVIGTAQYGQQPYNSGVIWQVNGTITPSLIRYIDLKFNLLFAQPLSTIPNVSNYNNTQGQFAYFRLQQTRRMRSHELNYIGHPLYGVLVKIVPVI